MRVRIKIKIIYFNSQGNEKLRIFGRKFVNNNQKICKIVSNNQEYELAEEFKIKNRIKLIGFNNVINMSYIFENCSSLISLPDIYKWNTNNVTNMSYMFYGCSSLKSLPDKNKLLI